MPRTAQFTVIAESDQAFTVPDPVNGINDRHFLDVRTPGAVRSARSVLALRVNPPGGQQVRLVVSINEATVLDQTFDTGAQRSWHEIVGPNVLNAAGTNEVTVAVVGSATPIQVSDLVLLYQADV